MGQKEPAIEKEKEGSAGEARRSSLLQEVTAETASDSKTTPGSSLQRAASNSSLARASSSSSLSKPIRRESSSSSLNPSHATSMKRVISNSSLGQAATKNVPKERSLSGEKNDVTNKLENATLNSSLNQAVADKGSKEPRRSSAENGTVESPPPQQRSSLSRFSEAAEKLKKSQADTKHPQSPERDTKPYTSPRGKNPRSYEAPKPKPGSRWAMVDRDKVEKGSSTVRNTKWQPKQQQRHRRPQADLKIMFFGDSFVRLFGLLKHPEMRVEGFKGASSKGLGRESNENRASILKQIKQHRPERIVLCFGSVDVHLSYYFTKYVKEGPTIDLVEVVKSYVSFVSSLKEFVEPSNIHVIGVYPSPLKPEHVQESLVAYGIITEDVTISVEDLAVEGRQSRVCEFNTALQEGCRKHGISFESAYDAMLDPSTNLLKPSFKDISSHNIHIVWETTVLLWMDRWPWFRALAKPGFKASLQKTLEEYLATKPWAESEHIATNIGVGEAFDLSKTDT